MTTSAKLWLGFGTLLTVLAGIVLVLIGWLHSLEERVDRITLQAGPLHEAAQEMEINVNGVGMAVVSYLHNGEAAQRSRVDKDIDDFHRYKAEYDRLAESATQRERGRGAARLFQEYLSEGRRLMAQKDRAEPGEQFQLHDFLRLRQQLDDLLDDEIQLTAMQALDTGRGEVREHADAVLASAYGLLLASLVIGGAFSMIVGHGILATERNLRAAVARAEKGEEQLRLLNEQLEDRVRQRTAELQQALDDVKQLHGLLPICAWCKKVRDDQHYWHDVETYVTAHTDAEFSHGICPDCLNKETQKFSGGTA